MPSSWSRLYSPTITTSVITDSTTFSLINTVATTVNAFGEATNINMGANGVSVNILGRIELGRRGASNIPYIDFHSGASDVDYDARFACSGGTGASGGGGLSIYAGSFEINCAVTTTNTTFSLINSTATTVNFWGAANYINMGANDVSVNIPGTIELGKRGVSNTPYIDFHSGATDVGADARIICENGNGGLFNGVLTYYANNGHNFAGSIYGSGQIVSNSPTGGVGYYTGAGGTVTQTTSKDTNVTLNKMCGVITMNNQALAAGAKISFYVFNSNVVFNDNVVVTARDGFLGNYVANVHLVSNGAFAIRAENTSGSSQSEALTINFAIIKSVGS